MWFGTLYSRLRIQREQLLSMLIGVQSARRSYAESPETTPAEDGRVIIWCASQLRVAHRNGKRHDLTKRVGNV